MNETGFGYQAELPESDRDVFARLCNDLAWLNAKWRLYLDLFSERENTELLSRCAPGFPDHRGALRTDMTMAICRLSDPSQTNGKQNLSLTRVAERYNDVPDLKEIQEKFNAACQQVKTIRNKRVGHNDLNTTLNPRDNPLPGMGRNDVETIIDLAARVLNVLVRSVSDTTYCFDLHVIGGGPQLLESLRVAERVEQVERERITALCQRQ